MTFHLLTDSRLPLADASLDRAVTRNTLIYVEDPLFTMKQLRRALRPGGLFHAIDSDWNLTVVEPVPTATWREIVDAASWAWPRPEMGRQLHGLASRSGFREVVLQVMTAPDTDGRLLGMIQTVIGYARESGAIAPPKLDEVLGTIEQAMADGTYLALAPQFLVTATA
jgi:SAM-dependent methyltransferase